MRWRARSPELQASRSGAYALAKAALAAVFVAMILLAGNVAQACPKQHDTAEPIKIERSAPGLAASVASHVTRPAMPSDGSCCGSDGHSHGFGCSGGCCSTGGPAVAAAGSSFAIPSASIDIAMRDQGEGPSLKSPPDYRPPRVL